MVYRPEVLLHRRIVIPFLIQVITVLAEDHVLLCNIDSGLLREVNRKDVQVALEEDLEFLL